jgi:hypothetical protein
MMAALDVPTGTEPPVKFKPRVDKSPPHPERTIAVASAIDAYENLGKYRNIRSPPSASTAASDL